MATKKQQVLELAILGALSNGEAHGYELRRRAVALLGAVRTLSFGSLYPALVELTSIGFLESNSTGALPQGANPRARIVYRLTADGKERLSDLLGQAGPNTWEDDAFPLRVALFGDTEQKVRVRILEGRKHRLEERLENLRESMVRGRERVDVWTLELQKHSEEAVEREVRWLSELIEEEKP